MWSEREKKALFRWSVFFALVHLISLVCIYGLDIPKSIVTVPLDEKNANPLFAITRWIDPLAWPIFATFFLFVLLPVGKRHDAMKADRLGDCSLHDVFVTFVVVFCLGSSLGFLIIGLFLSVFEGLVCGLLNGALAGLFLSAFAVLSIGTIILAIWGIAQMIPVFERFRENTPSFAWCLRPFEKLFGFLNAEDEKEDNKW